MFGIMGYLQEYGRQLDLIGWGGMYSASSTSGWERFCGQISACAAVWRCLVLMGLVVVDSEAYSGSRVGETRSSGMWAGIRGNFLI